MFLAGVFVKCVFNCDLISSVGLQVSCFQAASERMVCTLFCSSTGCIRAAQISGNVNFGNGKPGGKKIVCK